MQLQNAVLENQEGGRIVVTAPSYEDCQSGVLCIMDEILMGEAEFTYPVQQADGQWMATGRIHEISHK